MLPFLEDLVCQFLYPLAIPNSVFVSEFLRDRFKFCCFFCLLAEVFGSTSPPSALFGDWVSIPMAKGMQEVGVTFMSIPALVAIQCFPSQAGLILMRMQHRTLNKGRSSTSRATFYAESPQNVRVIYDSMFAEKELFCFD